MITLGLRQQIFTAASAEVIDELLETGKGYKFASDGTRRAWSRAARRRKAALGGEAYVPPAPSHASEAEKILETPKKRRGTKRKLNPVAE
jgi:hypothetical protein